jgi:glutamate-1-semialdehyde 2,1-aminomutase
MTAVRPANTRSAELMARAAELIPGGVNSPVRAFGAVGGSPRVIARANGARVWDVDGNELIDYIGSWGPMILGHAAPGVVDAVVAAARRGTSFGAPSEGEVALAAAITAAMPSIERIRFVNSGTEAAMSAVRLARAFTGRAAILKMAGGYHGHADPLLVRAGSGASGLPASAGVPDAVARDTIVVPYNDLDGTRRALSERDVAAVIVEPVAANMGVVLPEAGYLEGLREATTASGTLLIFDEVITGFRLGRGGAQERFGIRPDITVLGKIIGGGLPVGAYGGRADVMSLVAPLGPVYQAGTLSGNPLAMAAGLATLRALTPAIYAQLEATGARLKTALAELATLSGVAARTTRAGSLLTLFFEDGGAYPRFFHAMLDAGILLPPSPQEAWFISAAHRDAEIDATIDAARAAFAMLGDRDA